MIDSESPLKRHYNSFDLEHLRDFSSNDYIEHALSSSISQNNSLLCDEIKFRANNNMNFVASIEGEQGSGKSMFISSFALKTGEIFGVPFWTENIYFSPEDLKLALSKAKKRETFLRDEHRYRNAGMMSRLQIESLLDYEEQLRINQNNLFFASVSLQKHAHFFVFETKHIKRNKDGYPEYFIALMKTPHYTRRENFIWRGLISFPMPPKDFVEDYLKKKENHINNLKAQYGNTFDPIFIDATKLVEKYFDQLVTTTKIGFMKPINREAMKLFIYTAAEVDGFKIGTSKYTIEGYKLLIEQIRQLINKKTQCQNDENADLLTL